MTTRLILLFILLLSTRTASWAQPHIILDTDIGGDIDDLGALYALHVYADRGQCTIAAVMSSWAMRYHVNGIDAVNTYFGRPDIPVGAYADTVHQEEEYTWYLGEQYESDLTYDTAPQAIDLYRELLVASPDTSLTVVVTGRLNNIERLLRSAPDRHSPLTGVALVAQKVKAFYIMGGRYDAPTDKEANFHHGGPGVTQYVLANCPRPMIFNGGEVGGAAFGYLTGEKINNLPDENILKAGYQYFFQNPPAWTKREPVDRVDPWSIWDIITVQVAVTGGKRLFRGRQYGL